MKRRSLLTVLFALALLAPAMAQEPADAPATARKNSVKFLPVNLAFNSVSFEYERMISPKNSLLIGIGLPTNASYSDKFFFDNGDPQDMPQNDQLGVFALRAAYRHYTGKSGLPKGFYLSPYLKYQAMNASADIDEEDDMGNSYTNQVELKVNTMNLGFQLGYQFLIGKRVNIDFYFLGLEAGLAGVDGSFTPYDAANLPDVASGVRDMVDDLPSFIGDKLEVTQNSTSVLLKGNSIPFPFYRGGISIGIAF